MKKKIVPLLLSLAMLTGCSSLVIEDPFIPIEIEDAFEMFDNDETFGIIVSDSSAEVTSYLLPFLDEIKEQYDYSFYYVDLKNVRTSEKSESAEKLFSEEYLNLTSSYIPKIAMVVDGEVKASLEKNIWLGWFEEHYPLIKDAD